MNDALVVSLLSAVPKNATARAMGASTRVRLPRSAHRMLIHWFARTYGVDLDECDRPLDDYATFSDFFVRSLKDGARNVDAAPDIAVSPVDGRMHTQGLVEGGQFLQSDGKPASVAELLGGDATRFEGGSYAVIYLAPHNYHRVHVPVDGKLQRYDYKPGKLWPVFPAATVKVPELFGRNERLVFWLGLPAGALTLAMVGAFGVGRMTTPFGPVITNTGAPAEDVAVDAQVTRGQELGHFGLGSTVILVAEPGVIEQWEVAPGNEVRMGQRLARLSAG